MLFPVLFLVYFLTSKTGYDTLEKEVIIEVTRLDKYEYNLKLDQMKALCSEERYEEAAELADTINWNKVKNVNALVKVGEVFEKAERYQESHDVLLMAYDRSPIGRMIIYRLAEVAIKMKDFVGAQEYYDEFVKIAPHDSLRYVLMYHMKKAQDASYDELIAILEEFKEQEYIEEWAYELAYLYHKAEKVDKCVEACDELILWFGDGPYVERALELKMLYQPLTKQQEEKYRRFRQEKDGFLHISPLEMEHGGDATKEDVVIPPVEVNTGKFNTVNLQQEIVKGMQQIMNATEQSTVSDTMVNIKRITEEIPYLQIAKETSGMEEIGTEYGHIETDEEIDDALKVNFQELLEEDSDGQISMVTSDRMALEHQITGQITIQDVLDGWDRTRRVAETVLYDAQQRKLESAKARALQEAEYLMDRLNTVIPKLEAGITPKELLEEEYLGKSVEQQPEEPVLEEEPVQENVLGQELTEEVISEEEITAEAASAEEIPGETASEHAITAEEIPIPEAVDSKAPPIVFPKIEPIRLQKAPQILSPQMKAELEKTMKLPTVGVTQKAAEEIKPVHSSELLEEWKTSDGVGKDEAFELNGELENTSEINLAAEIDNIEEPEFNETLENTKELNLAKELESMEEVELPQEFEKVQEAELPQEFENLQELDSTAKFEFAQEPEALEAFGQLENHVDTEDDQSFAVDTIPEMEEGEEPHEQKKAEEPENRKHRLEATRKMPSWKEFDRERFMRQRTASIPEIPLPEDLDLFEDDPDKTVYESLTEKQKSIFSYFVPVKGMEDQLCKALTGMTNHLRRREAATSGNLIIQGEQGCGKTVLATSILKVLQEETGYLSGKVGKIDASSLNQKDLKEVVEKVKGGCLIIEKAGDLNQATVYSLARLMEKDINNTIYILEDTSKGIRKVLAREQIFTEKFTEKISVPIFTNEELVVFARAYSNELGYKIDDMAELALHNRISKIQRLDQATTLTQVKEIVDEAIDREAHGGLKKAISILTAKRYTEDDKIVLTERNFE